MRLWKRRERELALQAFLLAHPDFALCRQGSKVQWRVSGRLFSSDHVEHLLSFVSGRHYLSWTEQIAAEELDLSPCATVSIQVPVEVADDTKTFGDALFYQRRLNRSLRLPAPSLGAAV